MKGGRRESGRGREGERRVGRERVILETRKGSENSLNHCSKKKTVGRKMCMLIESACAFKVLVLHAFTAISFLTTQILPSCSFL